MNGVARASSGTAAATSALAPTVDCGRARADPQRAVATLDAPQLGDAADVDEVFEHGEAQREHRHEALAAGEHLRLVAELGEEVHRIRQRLPARGTRTVRASSCERTVRKNVRRSSAKSSGCSIAAK